MNQQKIMDMLIEAANPKCTERRRSEIQCEFGQASPALGHDGVLENETPAAGVDAFMDHIYVETLEKRPETLPLLFPIFAMICGDKAPDVLFADIEWSVLPA